MSVRLSPEALEEMRAHARATYPDECCGFLLGTTEPADDGVVRCVSEVEAAPNEFEGERRRRFLIRPEELRAAEDRALARGFAVLGFYHSHPDHPARPSEYDREHAWPWYVYVVLSVSPREVSAVGAFELDPDRRQFDSLGWEVPAAPPT